MSFLYNIIWIIAGIFVITISIYFTYKLKGIQFNFISIFKSLKNENKKDISTYKILSLSLAGRIGVGSLSGTALAIYMGGAGSIFWMWITTFLTGVLTFSESVLGNVYHKKDKDVYIGGPSYYINAGLGYKKLAKIYSVLIILGYIIGFLGIQSNTISSVINDYVNIDNLFIGIILSIFCSFAIFGGIKEITNITSKLVPIMSIFFILISGYILIINSDKLLNIILLIIKSAFNFKSAKYGIITSFIIGLQRSIFASEAGIGTSAITSAIASTNPKKQGYIQVFGMYFTVFIICSITSIIILLSNFNLNNFNSINGIEITSYAYALQLGKIGNLTIIILIILFAISTIISGYYYGESNLKNIFKKDYSFILKIVTIFNLLICSFIKPKIIWQLVDIFVGIIIIINVYSLLKLKKDIFLNIK